MTMEEIRTCPREFLTPGDIAPLLGVNPYAINVAAKTDPDRLGFPVCMIGRRVKIPRRRFLNFMDGRQDGK